MALFRNDSPGALTMEQAIERATQILEKEARRLEAVKKAKAEAGARGKKAARMAEHLAGQGRGSDTEIAHLARGEVVLPRLLQRPEVMRALARAAAEEGIPLAMLTVGNAMNSINPNTGAPEFGIGDWWNNARNRMSNLFGGQPQAADPLSDLPSVQDAVANAGRPLLSPPDGGLGSMMDEQMARAAGMPINISQPMPGFNQPYPYNSPIMDEITVTAPPVPPPSSPAPSIGLPVPGGPNPVNPGPTENVSPVDGFLKDMSKEQLEELKTKVSQALLWAGGTSTVINGINYVIKHPAVTVMAGGMSLLTVGLGAFTLKIDQELQNR
jgi:hypothetical protein